MRQCILNHPGCEGLTAGSVGAAGLAWPMICQNCKDVEDFTLRVSLEAKARAMDTILEVVDPTPLLTETLQ